MKEYDKIKTQQSEQLGSIDSIPTNETSGNYVSCTSSYVIRNGYGYAFDRT